MKPLQSWFNHTLLAVMLAAGADVAMVAAAQPTSQPSLPANGLFARTNLVAWCIVPFDAKKRGPEERAAMLDELGIKRFAYDYRAEHIPTFDAEIEALKKHGVELTAWWFPTSLNDEAKNILAVLKRHGEHPQLWVMGGGAPTHSPEEQTARVEAEANPDRLPGVGTQVVLLLRPGRNRGRGGVPQRERSPVRPVVDLDVHPVVGRIRERLDLEAV